MIAIPRRIANVLRGGEDDQSEALNASRMCAEFSLDAPLSQCGRGLGVLLHFRALTRAVSILVGRGDMVAVERDIFGRQTEDLPLGQGETTT
jgi:hypothetical protein